MSTNILAAIDLPSSTLRDLHTSLMTRKVGSSTTQVPVRLHVVAPLCILTSTEGEFMLQR